MHKHNIEIEVTLCMFPSYDLMSLILRRLSQEASIPQFSLFIRIRTQGSSGTETPQRKEKALLHGMMNSGQTRVTIGMSRLACPYRSCARDGTEWSFYILHFQEVFLGSTCFSKSFSSLISDVKVMGELVLKSGSAVGAKR